MPRPKTVSDNDVLTAALEVLAENGMNFTLTDLANHVGLSRATLIQRFGDRDAILRRMAEYELDATQNWLDGLSLETGPSALWQFLELIVNSMGAGEGFSARVVIAALEARDPVLRSLAEKKYQLVQRAIAVRLPKGPHQAATAEHLHAVIAGATMQWVASNATIGLATFVLKRLRWAFDHLPKHLT